MRTLHSGFILSLILLIAPSVSADSKNIQLKLPVRLSHGGSNVPQLGKDDFRLTINGISRNILSVSAKKKSLSQIPDLGRNFYLSFHLTEYNENVENGLSYFISEVLTSSDSLMISTPCKAYRMNVSTNKEKLKRSIESFLLTDSKIFKDERASAEKRLSNQVNSLRRTLTTETTGVTQYKKIVQFLNTFPSGLSNFKNQYLLPQSELSQQILSTRGESEAENWWIHFQQKESLSFFSRLKDVVLRMNQFIRNEEVNNQGLGMVLSRGLANLEEQIMISDTLPVDQFAHTFLENNTSYSVIFFRSVRTKGLQEEYAVWSDLVAKLEQLSRTTGGRTINATDSLQGILELGKHQDAYYEIDFLWNGKNEEKKIQVEIPPGNPALSYCTRISAEKLSSRVQYLATPKVDIDRVSLNKHVLNFRIHSFVLDNSDNIGLLKIRLEIWDEAGTEIKHRAENTLRASKKDIHISLPLEPILKGPHTLRITACDLIANRITNIDQLVFFD